MLHFILHIAARGGGGRTTRTRTCELRAVWPRSSDGRRSKQKGTYEQGGRGMSRLRRRLKARSYICMKQPCPAVTQLLNSPLDGRSPHCRDAFARFRGPRSRSSPSTPPFPPLSFTFSPPTDCLISLGVDYGDGCAAAAGGGRDEDVASVDEVTRLPAIAM